MEQELGIRLTFFFAGLLLFWGLGVLFAFRKVSKEDAFRWVNNLALIGFTSLLMRWILPASLVWLATSRQSSDLGLFHQLRWPLSLNVLFSVFILDGLIYFQHLIFHRIPMLWRLHAVHHSDTNIDTTTALRFHPIEILISIGLKGLAVFTLGITPVAIIVFEVLLNFSALFNHGNFSLPPRIEKGLRFLIVTPDMHRIHHSILFPETHSNFGFFFSFWDRFFKTYKKESQNDLRIAKIGLESFRDKRNQRLDQLLLQPFKIKDKNV